MSASSRARAGRVENSVAQLRSSAAAGSPERREHGWALEGVPEGGWEVELHPRELRCRERREEMERKGGRRG